MILIYSIASSACSYFINAVLVNKDITAFNIWGYGIGVFLRDLAFNLEHWI
jgi:hypothetical protein